MRIEIKTRVLRDITSRFKRKFGGNTGIGYLLGEKLEGEIDVKGVYVPKQKSSPAISLVQEEDVLNAALAIKKSGKSIVGLVQYHGNYKVFESDRTKVSRERLAEEGLPNLALIINSNGDYQISAQN